MTANLDELAPADIQLTISVKDDDWLEDVYKRQGLNSDGMGLEQITQMVQQMSTNTFFIACIILGVIPVSYTHLL